MLALWVLPVPQRYNLKAIHNKRAAFVFWTVGVTSSSKIQFESNSQRQIGGAQFYGRCYQFLKDTIWKQFTTQRTSPRQIQKVLPVPQRYNLKAIHNYTSPKPRTPAGVTSSSKIQFESNSQLASYAARMLDRCYQFLKDTIWKQFTTMCVFNGSRVTVLPVPQRYNLKAIHNIKAKVQFNLHGVTSSSKIQFESNSQLS